MAHTNVQFAVAAHILAVLGYHDGKEITSGELAQSVNADATFVRRAIAKLAKAGLLVTARGRNGACSLSHRPSEISLLDVYRASEAPAVFSLHFYPTVHACPISSNIKGTMQDVLDGSQRDFESSLARRTVADLVTDIKRRARAPQATRSKRQGER